MRRVRPDGLPEGIEYRDTGCDLAPSCLACPFEVCRYDDPYGRIRAKADAQVARVAALYAMGLAVNAIAAEMGLSRRSVFRLLALTRALTPGPSPTRGRGEEPNP